MRTKLRFVLETLGTLIISVAYGLLFFLILTAFLTFFGADLTPLFNRVDAGLHSLWPEFEPVTTMRFILLAVPFIGAGIAGVYLAREHLPVVLASFVFLPLVAMALAFIQQRLSAGTVDIETVLLVLIVFGLYGLRLTYSHSFKG